MTLTCVRSQRAAVVDVADACILIGRDGVVRRLDGDSAELAREVLAYLAEPRRDADVIAHVEELAGPLGDRRAVVEHLLALLRETGAIVEAAGGGPRSGLRIVVGVTGAIAASHAPALISALQRRGHTVEVACTATAARFVSIETLAALAQRDIHVSMWPRAAHVPVPHVALAAWAELVVIYPATATTIGRIAGGDFSELVAAIALTTRAPVVLAPSMNEAMLAAPAMQRNLAELRGDGFAILHGVPSQEAADAPALRDTTLAAAAPAPGDVAAAIDALLAANALVRPPAAGARAWDAAYRRPLVPWAREDCEPDLATALARFAPAPRRVLDIGCGLGQVARHAAAAGHRVVATDLSELALDLARARGGDVIWLRDDIAATALVGPFDVLVDRATLHALPPARARAWAASIRRLAGDGAVVIVKCHERGVPGSTTGWTAAALAALLPGFSVVADDPAELPSPIADEQVPARLIVLRRD